MPFKLILYSSSSFEQVITIHCLAELNLRAGVEQSFNCLIIQNHQAVQFMGTWMGWTFEDMVDGLFFCITLKAAEGVISYLCKQEWKHLTLVQRQISHVLGKAFPGVWVLMSGMKVQSLVVLSNNSAFHQ